jgi:hypothetical protein
MLLKLDLPGDKVIISLRDYLRILRADAAAWSVPEIHRHGRAQDRLKVNEW